jgi:hypothetical protein
MYAGILKSIYPSQIGGENQKMIGAMVNQLVRQDFVCPCFLLEIAVFKAQ